MVQRLADGTPLLIRPIRPDDKPLLSRGLSELSELSVHRRFLSPKPRFTSSELRYLTEVDGIDHVAFVAQRPGECYRLLGVARWVRLQAEPETAEIAIVVADDWQGRGIGSLLAEAVAEEARRNGIRRFTATILSDNVPAQRLMTKLAGHLDRRVGPQGASELIIDLAA
jgi:RimJ/RimL family protein N-acetyltransferase